MGRVHVEGPLDDRCPLQAADDEGVGARPLRPHQLALWEKWGENGKIGKKIIEKIRKIGAKIIRKIRGKISGKISRKISKIIGKIRKNPGKRGKSWGKLGENRKTGESQGKEDDFCGLQALPCPIPSRTSHTEVVEGGQGRALAALRTFFVANKGPVALEQEITGPPRLDVLAWNPRRRKG